MAKLTDKERKKIVADYLENQNYNETARMNNTSWTTVKRVVLSDENILKKIEEKKEENTLSTLEYMDEQHGRKKNILDKLLKAIEDKSENIDMFTNVKDLATAYGIIVDKELKLFEIKNKLNNEDKFEKVEELLSIVKAEADKNDN